jgi:hypothetical protein
VTEHSKRAITAIARKGNIWRALLLLAAGAYAACLYLAWWKLTFSYESQTLKTYSINGRGTGNYDLTKLGELCLILAVAIIFVGLLTLRFRDVRLPLILRQLAVALVVVTPLQLFDCWHASVALNAQNGSTLHSQIASGAFLAIGSSLLALVTAFVLAAGAKRSARP